MKLLAVFIGGGLGSICRFLLASLNDTTSTSIPYGTLLANFVSSFILGALVAWFSQKSDASPTAVLLLTTGFCGGFSTFSTFSLELFQLTKNGFPGLAFIYLIISIGVGILAIWLGFRFFA